MQFASPKQIRYLICHHTDGPQDQTVEEIAKFHTDPPPQGRGWLAIGYHRLINHRGEVFQGRPDTEIGAQAFGANSVSLGICCIGNYMEEAPSAALQDALVQVLAVLAKRYHIPIANILGHRDARVKFHVTNPIAHTSCPGDALYNLLPDIRFRVAKYL